MPQPRKPRNDNDLTPDAGAPAAGDQPSGSLVLSGILGESTVADHVRLFLDTGFTKYYDVPADAIEKREQLPAERSPLGVDSSIIWVAKGTDLVLHQTETRKVEDEFLAGDFTDAGSFVPAEVGGAAVTTIVTTCRPTLGIACTITTCETGAACTHICGDLPGPTGTFRCTQIRCPIGHTGWRGCSVVGCPPHSLATICPTQQVCPTHQFCPSEICEVDPTDVLDHVTPERAQFPHTMICFPRTEMRCPTFSPAMCPPTGMRCPTFISRCPRPSALGRCPSFGRCPSIAGCPTDFGGGGFGGPVEGG
jgi:hypothetical protein